MGDINRSIFDSKHEYVVLISPHVIIDELDISSLTSRMTQFPEVAAVQPKVLSRSIPTHYSICGGAGGLVDKLGYHYIRGSAYQERTLDSGQFDKGQSQISWFDGTLVCLRKSVFEEIGGFDSALNLQSAMMDLSMRIHQLGYEIHLITDSTVYFDEDKIEISSVDSLVGDDITLRMRMLIRYKTDFIIPLVFIHWFFDMLRAMLFVLRLKWQSAFIILKTYGRILVKLPQMISERETTLASTNHPNTKIHSETFSIYWRHYGKLGSTASNALAVFLVIASVFSLTMRDRR